MARCDIHGKKIVLILTQREACALQVLAEDAFTDTSDPVHRGPPELFPSRADRRAAERAYKVLTEAVLDYKALQGQVSLSVKEVVFDLPESLRGMVYNVR